MKRIQLSRVHRYMRNDLEDKLRRDMRAHRILKEGDVECCTYYHLRHLLRADSRWQIFARKHSQKTGHYIDLVLFRKTRPKLAIEIKWHREKMSRKDRKSLRSARKKLRTRKNYFIVVTPDASNYEAVHKSIPERYRLFEIVVDLGYVGKKRDAKIKQWRIDKRRKFGI